VRLPKSLSCGHTLCQSCLQHLHRHQCPFDQATITQDTDVLPINYALLHLTGVDFPEPYPIPEIPDVQKHSVQYEEARGCIEDLATYLKPLTGLGGTTNNNNNGCPGTTNGSSSNGTLIIGNILTRPMQRKLVTLVNCQLVEEEGRIRAMRAARSLGERTVTELLLLHQNQNQVSANLWAAVRARGCQFLGPAMQEEALKLILIALENGEALSRKVLVLYVVQKLETMFPQASKTSIGHVVQLLYRASCFKVFKRDEDSSLMQLKEQYRTYDALRREHDSQIVHIAMEAGLRINPEQWSSLLYGDQSHKSHMQSIIDKLQTPASFSSSIQELTIALQRTGDPGDLGELRLQFETLAKIDASPSTESKVLSWDELEGAMKAVRSVVNGFVEFTQTHGCKMKGSIEQQQVQSGKYKTSMCRDMIQRGMCPRKNSCTFAHSEEELEKNRKRSRSLRYTSTSGVVARGSGGDLGFVPSDEESNSSGQSRGGSQRSSPQSVGVNGTMDDQIPYGFAQYRRPDLVHQTTNRFHDLNLHHFQPGTLAQSPTRNSPITVQENGLSARTRSGSEGYDVPLPVRQCDERMLWNGRNGSYPVAIQPVQREMYRNTSDLYITPGQAHPTCISTAYSGYSGMPYHPSPRIDYPPQEYFSPQPMPSYPNIQYQMQYPFHEEHEMQFQAFKSRAPCLPSDDSLAADLKSDPSPIGSDGDVTDGPKEGQGLGLSVYIRDHPRKAQDIYSRAHLNSSSSSGISSSSSAGGHSSPNSHSPSSLSPRQPSPIGWNSSSDSLELCSSLLRDISNEDKHFPSMSKICDKTGKVEEHIWMPTNGKGLDWPAVGSERWERDRWSKQDLEKEDQWSIKHQGLLMQGYPTYSGIRTDQWADPELQRRVEQERKDAQLARELHKEEQLKSGSQKNESENLANDEAIARELQRKINGDVEGIKSPVKNDSRRRAISPGEDDFEEMSRNFDKAVAERQAMIDKQTAKQFEQDVQERRKLIEKQIKQSGNEFGLDMNEFHRQVQLRKMLVNKQASEDRLFYTAPSAMKKSPHLSIPAAFSSNGGSMDFKNIPSYTAFGGNNSFQPLKCASSILNEGEDKLSSNIVVKE